MPTSGVQQCSSAAVLQCCLAAVQTRETFRKPVLPGAEGATTNEPREGGGKVQGGGGGRDEDSAGRA